MNKKLISQKRFIEQHKRATLSLLFLFATSSLMAQIPSFKWEGGLAAKHQWNEKWALKTTFLARETFNSYASETVKPYLDRYEAKAFISYSLANKQTVALGYTFRHNNPFRDESYAEHRITQQYSIATQYLEHKLRVEERIFKQTTAIRLRYKLTFEKAIRENQRTILILADELLLNFKNGNQSFENRLDVGIGRKLKNGRKLKLLLSNRNENLFGKPKKHYLQLISVYSFNI